MVAMMSPLPEFLFEHCDLDLLPGFCHRSFLLLNLLGTYLQVADEEDPSRFNLPKEVRLVFVCAVFSFSHHITPSTADWSSSADDLR